MGVCYRSEDSSPNPDLLKSWLHFKKTPGDFHILLNLRSTGLEQEVVWLFVCLFTKLSVLGYD